MLKGSWNLRRLAFAGVVALIACPRPAMANPVAVSGTQTITQPNQTYVTPPVVPGFDDHSASSTPYDPPGPLDKRFNSKPPKELLIFTGDVRGISDRVIFTAPGVIYTNAYGTDLWSQLHWGDVRGYSVGLRQEFGRRRLTDAIQDHRSAIKKARNPEELIRTAREAFRGSNDLVLRLRVALNLSYTRASSLDLDDIPRTRRSYADRLLAGIAVSRLYPVDELLPKPRPNEALKLEEVADSPGVFWSASAQAVVLDPDDGERTTGIRFGLRLGWQDAIPYVAEDEAFADKVGKRTRRWHWQTGVELISEDSTTDAPVVAVFLRHRIEPTKERRANMEWDKFFGESFEISLSGGVALGGHAFVALRFSKPFSL